MSATTDDDRPRLEFDRSAQPGAFGRVAEEFARGLNRRQLLRRGVQFVFAATAATLAQGSFGVLDVEAIACCQPPGGTPCPTGDCSSSGSSCKNGCYPDTQYWSPGNCWSAVCNGVIWYCCDCWCPAGLCNTYACGCAYRDNGPFARGLPDSPVFVQPKDRRLTGVNPNC